MLSSRTFQLLTVLVLLGCYSPALCQEPNEVKTKLSFEISAENKRWPVKTQGQDKIDIRPTYMAELFVPNMPPAEFRYVPPGSARVMYSSRREPKSPTKLGQRSWRDPKPIINFRSPEIMRALLDTPSGKSVTQEQRKFFVKEYKYSLWSREEPSGVPLDYKPILLYAVSKEDAKKMAHAFVEFLTAEADKEMTFWQDEEKRLLDEIENVKRRISQVDQELKAAQGRLTTLENDLNYLTSDEAEAAVLELNKMLNSLVIELATRGAKLEAIQLAIQQNRDRQEAERNRKPEERVDRTTILQKLEEMQVYELIELRTAEAKREAATRMKWRAQEFVGLRKKVDDLGKKADGLSNDKRGGGHLERLEGGLSKVQSNLANPTPEMLAPKVYENKVTIYPVRANN